MNHEREQALLRITAQYTDEIYNSQHPKLSDYLARYPQYADELAEFAAYFHAFEENLPVENSTEDYANSPLLAEFYIAADAAIDHILCEQDSTVDLQRVAEAPSNYQLNKHNDKI